MKTTIALGSLLRFYRLEGQDAGGRTLPEIWAWDDARLEAVHDYIQWLFPLPEPSAFNPLAPILDAEAMAAFHESPPLRQRLARSLERLLAFYGLTLTAAPPPADDADDALSVVEQQSATRRAARGARESAPPNRHAVRVGRAATFADRSRVWLRPGNHNHLRLTRILTSLRLLGLEDHAGALVACLETIAREHPHAISATTLAYWRRAATP